MPTFNVQQQFEPIAVGLGASEATSDATATLSVQDYTAQQAREQINTSNSSWRPSLVIEYRRFDLANQEAWTWSPIQLFLLFFGPVLQILTSYTNEAMRRKANTNKPLRPFTEAEVRRWIACRLAMFKNTNTAASMRLLWT